MLVNKSTAQVGSLNLTGKTRLYGIVGDPVSKVRAPQVWTGLFQHYGIDAVLVPIHATPANFHDVMVGLKATANLDGLILTMPHKVAGLTHCDSILGQASHAGAVNVLRRDGESWTGDILDGLGFVAGLRANGIAPEGLEVFQAGAGGVGTAIALALGSAGVRKLYVCDSDLARSAALVDRILACGFSGLQVEIATCVPPTAGLAINATPMGMHPQDPLPFQPDRLAQGAVVAEVIMDPIETPLLAAAREVGLKTHHGRFMMDEQIVLMAEFYRLPKHDWTIAGCFNQSPAYE